jgi:hypothetical protein
LVQLIQNSKIQFKHEDLDDYINTRRENFYREIGTNYIYFFPNYLINLDFNPRADAEFKLLFSQEDDILQKFLHSLMLGNNHLPP